MAFLNLNNSDLAQEDCSNDCDYFDNVQQDLLQHFNKDIRISSGTYFQTPSQPLPGTATLSQNGTVLLAGMKMEEPCVENGNCDGKGVGSDSDSMSETRQLNHAVRRDSDANNTNGPIVLNHILTDSSKLFDNDSTAGSLHCDFKTPNSDYTNSFAFASQLASSLDNRLGDEGPPGTLPIVVKRPLNKSGITGKLIRKTKEPSLNVSFPSKIGTYDLKIIRQPEEQHRARYLTEGSRGTVKDKSGQGHPTVKLFGYDQPVTLQVFVGTDVGKLKPHGFYQACKVSNKNSTSCIEKDIEGTTVIELILEPKQDMTSVVDCVGILKLRNADVEQRIGLAKSKKKSTCARLVFRVNIPKPDGTFHSLQVSSTPILCTQPTGAPEISKKKKVPTATLR